MSNENISKIIDVSISPDEPMINLSETRKMKMLNTLKTVFLLGTIASSLTACNTVSGVGEDVQAGGHALEHAGDNSKPRHYDNAGR